MELEAVVRSWQASNPIRVSRPGAESEPPFLVKVTIGHLNRVGEMIQAHQLRTCVGTVLPLAAARGPMKCSKETNRTPGERSYCRLRPEQLTSSSPISQFGPFQISFDAKQRGFEP